MPIRSQPILTNHRNYQSFSESFLRLEEKENSSPISTSSSAYFSEYNPMQIQEDRVITHRHTLDGFTLMKKTSKPTFHDLHQDILFDIMEFISQKDFQEISLTCKKLYLLLREDFLKIPFELKPFLSIQNEQGQSVFLSEKFIHYGNWQSLIHGIEENLKKIEETNFEKFKMQQANLIFLRCLGLFLLSLMYFFTGCIIKENIHDEKGITAPFVFNSCILIVVDISSTLLAFDCFRSCLKMQKDEMIDAHLLHEIKIKQREIKNFIHFFENQKKHQV